MESSQQTVRVIFQLIRPFRRLPEVLPFKLETQGLLTLPIQEAIALERLGSLPGRVMTHASTR